MKFILSARFHDDDDDDDDTIFFHFNSLPQISNVLSCLSVRLCLLESYFYFL